MNISYQLFKDVIEEEFSDVECHCYLNPDQTATLLLRLNDFKRSNHVIPSIDFRSASYRELSLLIIDIRKQLDELEACSNIRLQA